MASQLNIHKNDGARGHVKYAKDCAIIGNQVRILNSPAAVLISDVPFENKLKQVEIANDSPQFQRSLKLSLKRNS